MIIDLVENQTIVDGWSLLHWFVPFILGFFLFYQLKPYIPYLLIIGYEVIENTLLKGNSILMAAGPESTINIVGDIAIGIVAVAVAINLRERSKR